MTPPLTLLHHALWDNRRRWFGWFVVGVGVGCGGYFMWPSPPPLYGLMLGWALWLTMVFVGRYGPKPLATGSRYLAWGLCALMVGWSAGAYRMASTATVMLTTPYSPISLKGQVTAVDLAVHGHKYTLDFVRYYPWRSKPAPPADLPRRLILMVTQKSAPVFEVGDRLYIRVANLMPLPSPLSGHDGRRLQSYLQGIGAKAVALKVPEKARGYESSAPPEVGSRLWVASLRQRLTQYLYERMPGQQGAVAAALITGKKSAINRATQEAFANAGLAHLLAISGLHLTLMASFIYGVIGVLGRLIPSLALTGGVHRLALMVAFMGACGYAVISGWAVPVQRSLVMLGIVMGGMMLYRTPFSVRSVALAALLILLLTPENVLSLSFQLSFAAVLGLIAFFETNNQRLQNLLSGGPVRYLGTMTVSSIVAGVMTLPFTMFYFHKYSLQSIAANLVAIPVTGFWVLPLAPVALVAYPFGGADWVLMAMGWGMDVLIEVATTVAQWPGALLPVRMLPGWFLGVTVFGGLWLCLWRGWLRWLGLIPIAGAALAWLAPLPLVMLSHDGKLMGLVGEDTLWVNGRGNKRFEQQVWQEMLHKEYRKPWKQGGKLKLPPTLGQLEGSILHVPHAHLTCRFEDAALRKIAACTLNGHHISLQELTQKGPLFVEAGGKKNWLFPGGRQREWLQDS